TPDAAQTFEICITGPSFPSGSEEGACQVVGAAGGELVWTNLLPGTYVVVESDPGVDWNVTGSSANVEVPAATRALHTITNTLIVVPPPVDPQVGSLDVTKVVDWADKTPDATQSFQICIAGPSFPNGNEANACYSFSATGGSHTWTDLAPGAYTVTEVGVDTGLWTVTGSGASVEVVANNAASHTVTNTLIDVGGEGGTPTALDPTDEPAATFTARLYLPAVQR
ncbi:MAG: hypothetical protein KDE01_24145, partial [Caldilineaceae bacterium]|nr:hypothetical protein [Caldilineaceae bacterium]